MKIKLFLGGLGAVTILLLVSFTSVVSVQSIISSSVNDSPLFSIRIQKAADQDSKTILTSNYLGRGERSLPFPQLDDKTALIQEVIRKIQMMDEKEFNRFQNRILSHFSHESKMKHIDIINLLEKLKVNHSDLISNKTQFPLITSGYIYTCFTMDNWIPGCLVVNFIIFVFYFFMAFNP